MRTTIHWHYAEGSRLGNQLMQFASVYALSKDFDICLNIPAIEGFPATCAFGRPDASPNIDAEPLAARHFIDQRKVARLCANGIDIVNGSEAYLENIYNFDHRRDELRKLLICAEYDISNYSFFKWSPTGPIQHQVEAIGENDLVISLRLGDFLFKRDATEKWREAVYTRFLGIEYFAIVLDNIEYDQLFITSDEPFNPVIKCFTSYDPIIVAHENPTKTMHFVGRFRRIAISESTFSWWAAYLAKKAQIFYPISTKGLWGVNKCWERSQSRIHSRNKHYDPDHDLYLRVDSPDFIYVYEPSKEFFAYSDAPGRRSQTDFQLELPPPL